MEKKFELPPWLNPLSPDWVITIKFILTLAIHQKRARNFLRNDHHNIVQSCSQSPHYPCPAAERATRTSGGKLSAMTCAVKPEFQDFCIVQRNVHMRSRTGSPRILSWRISSPQRSLLPIQPLDKGNKDSGNEIAYSHLAMSWLILRNHHLGLRWYVILFIVFNSIVKSQVKPVRKM